MPDTNIAARQVFLHEFVRFPVFTFELFAINGAGYGAGNGKYRP
jgi:hypothetical protein